MFQCAGYAARNTEAPFAPFRCERRDPGPSDVEMIPIETAYARMVKSDVKYRFVIDMGTLPKAA